MRRHVSTAETTLLPAPDSSEENMAAEGRSNQSIYAALPLPQPGDDAERSNQLDEWSAIIQRRLAHSYARVGYRISVCSSGAASV
ncbi:hypothetical protein SFHH103_04006 (plasmid) [Sinorhizobium fredii HH103]|uniref:Uncharacterized protein n=1 Tax=Sinorhizobium fredii (strain HH103) TaxID=1117943 RepID=G9ABR8_SINF1|nr:hypothetical protein SFHH103_04006 [Sinorhizobium fredii HH103]